ncbi:ASST-domain-containing protein [Leptodontidium sp. 2 PMI_412]|nr:ASST-domain-containing protein [Leptodontidium sp. 2 PMI_412]
MTHPVRFIYLHLRGNNFHVTQYQGDDVLVAYEANAEWNNYRGVGHVTILNKNYVPIKTVVGNGIMIDVHEFKIVDEIDLETSEVLFEWSSLDHVSPDETIEPISTLSSGTGVSAAEAIDYMHMNSLDKDGDDYLVSGRRTSTIYKIDGKSGKVIWRLGGRLSNFTLGPGVEFGLQHHARFISRSEDGHQTVISLFDNSGQHLDDFAGRYENRSSGKIIVVDTSDWSASLSQKFQASDKLFASCTGSAQVLPEGNMFINWGLPGAMTEFTRNGTIVFQAYLDSGELFRNGHEFTYRASKSNWTGIPRENPALVALTHDEITTLYVSWNGDTETKRWQFYGVDDSGKEVLLGDEARSGFETSFSVGAKPKLIAFRAAAVVSDGNVARTSKLVKSKPQIFPYVPGKDDSGDSGDNAQAAMQSENGEP